MAPQQKSRTFTGPLRTYGQEAVPHAVRETSELLKMTRAAAVEII